MKFWNFPKFILHMNNMLWSILYEPSNVNILGEFLRDKMYNSIPGLSKPTEDQKAASLQLFEQIAGGALRSS